MAVPRHGTLLQVNRPLRRPLKTGDQSQQSCLSAAGGSQQTEQFTGCKLQIDAPQRPRARGATVVTMPEVTDGNSGLGLRQQRNAMIGSILRFGHDRSRRHNFSSSGSCWALQPGCAGRRLVVLLWPDPVGSSIRGHGRWW